MQPGGAISRIIGVPRLSEPPTGSTRSVSVEVVRVLGPGRFLIQYGGRSATAFSTLDLQPGQVLHAQLSQENEGLILRVPMSGAEHSLTAILQELGLSQDSAMRSVVEAMLRSGLGLNPERLNLIHNRLKAHDYKGRFASVARLAALLEDKGLSLDFLPLLRDAVFGPSHKSDSNDRGSDHEESEQDRQSPQSMELDVREHKERVDRVCDQLRSLVQTKNAPDDESPPTDNADLLRLFNTCGGHSKHWIVIPFLFSRDSETQFDGRLRLCFDGASLASVLSGGAEPGKAFEQAVLECSTAHGNWSCEIAPGLQGFNVQLRTPGGETKAAATRYLDECEHIFAAAGITLRVCDGDNEIFDGFSSESSADIIHDIDLKA